MAKLQYDVYINNLIQPDDSELIVARFPAMRSQFDNPPDQIEFSMKPKSMKMKLDVKLDTDSNSFDKTKALALAKKSKPHLFSEDKGVHQNTYNSTKHKVEDGQLFVCKTVNDKLVCRPISHLITMRSDLSHFDLKEETDPREEIKPVSVKFATTDRQNNPARTQENQEFDEALEEYQVLKFKSMGSREAVANRIAIFGKQVPRVKVEPDELSTEEKPKIFIPDIKPKIEKMDTEVYYTNETQIPHNSPRKSKLIRQRVKECLLKAKVASFEEVYCYIRDYRTIHCDQDDEESISINNKDILDALSEFALIVQGNWAIKSETLYGDSGDRECTDFTGISINLFTAARDYLLWLFNQDRIVSRLEYSKKVRIPDHDILELFKQLSTFRKDINKWEFKLPTDKRFIDLFPEIVQRQTTFWKVRRANKLAIFN